MASLRRWHLSRAWSRWSSKPWGYCGRALWVEWRTGANSLWGRSLLGVFNKSHNQQGWSQVSKGDIQWERWGGRQITHRLIGHGNDFIGKIWVVGDMIYLTLKRLWCREQMIQGPRMKAGRPVGILLQWLRWGLMESWTGWKWEEMIEF